MEIKIEWRDGKYPSFNLSLCKGDDPFVTIRGCQIKEHEGREFIAWPAKKNDSTGKWWSHVWCSFPFQDAVLAKAKAAQPSKGKVDNGTVHDMDDDLMPF